MKNFAPLLTVVLFCHSIIFGQHTEIDPFKKELKIVNAAGGDALSNEGSISYSLGTTFYTTLEATHAQVSHGAQQAENHIVAIGEPISIQNDVLTGEIQALNELNIVAIPNPAVESTTIYIKDFEPEGTFYYLFDQHGKLLESNLITRQATKVMMKHRSAAIYLLRVIIFNKESKTFKIIKN